MSKKTPELKKPEYMVVDGRIKRDIEFAEHIRHLARELVDRRGIAKRLALDLIDRRERERDYYFGRGAEEWAAWVQRHPEHVSRRAPEPPPLTEEEAVQLAMEDAEKQVWREAYDQGVTDMAPLQRRHLDYLWIFIHTAESELPSPSLSKEDRLLVRRAYTMATAILGWAYLVESGKGAEPWKTRESRPIKPIGIALKRILDDIDKQQDFVRIENVEKAEKVVAARSHFHRSFDAAKKLYREWRIVSGSSWQTKQGAVHRKITEAFKKDLDTLFWGPKDEAKLRGILDLVLHKMKSPADAADLATTVLLGVTINEAKAGAKVVLAKARPAPQLHQRGPSFSTPTSMSLLRHELQTIRIERYVARQLRQSLRDRKVEVSTQQPPSKTVRKKRR